MRFALILFSYLGLVASQAEHEGEEHCPPENPNCHIPTGAPSFAPTPAPSTPQPTFIYTIDFSNTIETKIAPEDGTEMDYFGFATAIHHTTAIVGAYGSKDKGQNSGSVYIYETNATSFPYYDDGSTPWDFKQKLVIEKWEEHCDKEGCQWREAEDHQAENSQFGYALGVYGDTIVVGAHRHEEAHAGGGGAYIYTKQSDGVWTQSQILTPEDGHAYHYFGYSCSIYGSVIVLGAAGDEHGGVSSGSAYVYEYDDDYSAWFTTAKLTSTNAQAFDNFGSAVDVYKNWIVVGATGDETNGADSGAAYIYIKFGTWVQEMKLTAYDGETKHYFGSSVSIYEDTVAIGAYQGHGHWDYAGAVYIYYLVSGGIDNPYAGSWNLQQKVIAHDGMSEDKFGWSISVYKDNLIVGAFGEMGKQQDDHPHLRNLNGRALQGPPEQENCGPNSPPDCQKYQGEYSYRGASTGSVYVFARSGTTWLQEFKLIADGSEAYDSFGKSVAIHENVLFVGADMADGAIYDNTGAAYIWAPATMSPSIDSDSTTSFLAGNVKFDALVAITFVLIPMAVVGIYYYSNKKSDDVVRNHLPVSTDSQHGSSAPWSMHGAFDDSSRGASSFGGRGPAPVATRSPLQRGPPVARGL